MILNLPVPHILFSFNCRAAWKLFVAVCASAFLLSVYSAPIQAKKKQAQAQSENSSSKGKGKVKKRKAKEATEKTAAIVSPTKKILPSEVNDVELAAVYQAISQGKSGSALGQIEALLIKAPNYKLLHLLRADLLLILSQKQTLKTTAGTSFALPPLSPDHLSRINQLQQQGAISGKLRS